MGVKVGFRYREMRTAKEFGKMPHEWDSAPARSRAEAVAFNEVHNLIEAYQSEQMEAQRESSN